MSEKQWVLFFREEAPRYMANGFTKSTVAEVDFIVRELGLREGESILDVGCGTGRHPLELTRRGFSCPGIDQSAEMLEITRAAARNSGLHVNFVQGEASATALGREFDHALCLCEGAFSLLEPGAAPVEFHQRILRNVHGMLNPGGRFLLTVLNGLRMVRERSDEDVSAGRFDLTAISVTEQHPGPGGTRVTVVEKGFYPSELSSLLEASGFEVLSMGGGTAGSWNKQGLRLDEIEIMAPTRKAARPESTGNAL